MLKFADPAMPSEPTLNITLFDKSRAEIYGYILGFFERLGLFSALGVSASEFLDFLMDVDQGYLPNAYHSFYHAADVTMVLYHMLCHFEVEHYLSRVDMAALLIAALCHDIGHPGKNNNYQVNLNTDLAVRYNNKSVLESYSCSLTMELLTKHRLLRHVQHTSVKIGVPTSELQLRSFIIKMILATDMIFHYELQENMTGLLEIINEREESMYPEDDYEDGRLRDLFSNRGDKSPISYFREQLYFKEEDEDVDEEEEEEEVPGTGKDDTPSQSAEIFLIDATKRQLLCQTVLHAADISNALRPWPVCQAWSQLVCEEFFGQGDAERLHGLQVSPSMDRNQTSQTTISLQFGDYVVSPYFEIFAALFPKADELVKRLAENRQEWLSLEAAAAGVEDEEDRGQLPSTLLPDRPILNPTGRRVSVAAGMIVIPDELEERTIGSGKSRRTYLGVRSASQSEISRLDRYHRKILDERGRRRSEEPSLYLKRLQLASISRRGSRVDPALERVTKRSNSIATGWLHGTDEKQKMVS
ncbi:High affinity cAMP-specific and IBMX-insensitive 3',5'-cyclic phosphodiesterase 9A [Apophysomyces sp. BC1034]|nr:High affinity cAMP-specific and IBMX-insensitive 3',5'-cyclic phosphodiesterase 9A [Apophysomyces sp. BC1015]KAG0181885.1 High affinity cAMP-specific and IBMX-insensitive 3',5'-cyclic phosphodiesterase 9A [Apophysomyces sp. BC1021]KAG0192642.1 High affinity cAMP-specific and IBMX-insensitive 3',5'-cyclic phosphodiesterase 9A [Apophysomyces sp. BC1034]